MRAPMFTMVYAVILVLCLIAPKVLSVTNSLSDEAWLVNYDLGEEESEEESQEEKSEAEFYVYNSSPSLTALPYFSEATLARPELSDSIYHPEVFAPPPEMG